MLNAEPRATPSHATAGRWVISLDGVWDFSFEGVGASLSGLRMPVPGIWQAHHPALRNSNGTGTYQREVAVPELKEEQRLFLIFDGVFHLTTVAIDGTAVATHRSAWIPFEVDITDRVRNRQKVTLRVAATVPDDTAYPQGGLGTMLHGKQDWYGLQGGIWKSVRLEVREAAHFRRITITGETNLVEHSVAVAAELSATIEGQLVVTVSRNGATVAEKVFPVSGDGIDARLRLEDVALWSPSSPNLYDVEAVLRVGSSTDVVTRTVGFRTFEAREGRLYLNGAPFYMIGALDQDWYPEEECRAPDVAFLEQRFRNAKALGLNTLRCHVKIPDAAYFEVCDRLGLIVWLDMPYTEFLASQTRADLLETFAAAAANHGHHPSICVWTIINEGWGIDLDDNPDDRAWLSQSFDRLKRLVPQSLLVDNSPCFPRNYHVKTEIDDFHWYNNWPAQNDQFQATTDAFAARPQWSFSPHGDATRSGKEPLVVSEFGVWGLPHPHDIREKDGREPWWFDSGHEWNNGAGLPHGIEARFRDAGLARVFGDLDHFIDHAQRTQYRGLKYQIETLRYAEPISGYVITELNDTQWEANGLMDARNNPRAFAGELAALQTPWLVVGRAERTALRPGEEAKVRVRLSGATRAPEGTVLSWRFGATEGHVALTTSKRGSREVVIVITAAHASAITTVPLRLEAHDGDGLMLSANSLEFCIVPGLVDAPALQPADKSASQLLKALHWPAGKTDPGATLLATRLTTPVREALLAGRKVLLIANDLRALTDPKRSLPQRDLVNFPKMEIRPREGTYWDGRWMGAFSWRRTDGPWAALPNGPMLDEHWQGLHPRYVLTGFRSTAFAGLVDAGVVVAWVHKAAAFSKRSFLGKGWLTVTTFDLGSAAAQANPLAPHVLAALARS